MRIKEICNVMVSESVDGRTVYMLDYDRAKYKACVIVRVEWLRTSCNLENNRFGKEYELESHRFEVLVKYLEGNEPQTCSVHPSLLCQTEDDAKAEINRHLQAKIDELKRKML